MKYPPARRDVLRALLAAMAAIPLATACGGAGAAPTSAVSVTSTAPAATAANSAATSVLSSPATTAAPAAAVPSGAAVKLVFLSRGDLNYQAVFKESITHFQQQFPAISIDNQPTPTNFDQKLETMLAGNVAPDVFFGMAATFLVYPTKGATIPLDSYAAKGADFSASDYYPYWLKTMRWKGKLVALPYDPDMVVLYYNKAIFDKAGIAYPDATTPMTWDQVVTLAQQLTIDRRGNHGAAADRSQVVQYGLDPLYARMWWQLPRQYGLDVFTSDLSRTTLDQQAAINGLQTLIDLGAKYHVTTTPDSGTGAPINLESNSLAMVINGGWQRGYYLQQVKSPWDIAPLPQVKGQARVGMGWASGLMITKQSKNPDQGWQFLAYLAGKNGQHLLLQKGISQPMLTSMASDPAFTAPAEPAHKDVLLNEVASGDPPPYIPAYLEIQTAIQNDLLDVALTGKQTVQTAVATVVPKINAILANYKQQFGE